MLIKVVELKDANDDFMIIEPGERGSDAKHAQFSSLDEYVLCHCLLRPHPASSGTPTSSSAARKITPKIAPRRQNCAGVR